VISTKKKKNWFFKSRVKREMLKQEVIELDMLQGDAYRKLTKLTGGHKLLKKFYYYLSKCLI